MCSLAASISPRAWIITAESWCWMVALSALLTGVVNDPA
ncbi:Uncharacterised protein [Mycobacterium tuberculosis]|uniref:Uncharacterized protein n=1 Tax=Mycobacterium tuberculosis TaxID=1773 RepID=A0A916LF84_MYCTX|nr:Uncharacterised protein [Mycobacterium tuberculosis]